MKENPFPVMEHMTVKLVREYLQRKQSIIIPMGVIEQHGYHLPLCTDAVIASELAWRIGRKTDILVAPVIYSSFSGGGLPGTINISPAVMSLVVSDELISLAAQGFRKIYIFLAHGGSENARALDNALQLLLRNNPTFKDVMVALIPNWRFGYKDGPRRTGQMAHDWHAGWIETSLMMALRPDLVRIDEMELDPEPLLKLQIEHPDNYQHAEKPVDDPYVVPRMTQHPEIKVGVMGYPEKANVEFGQGLIDECVELVGDKILQLEAKFNGVYKEVEFIPEPIIMTMD